MKSRRYEYWRVLAIEYDGKSVMELMKDEERTSKADLETIIRSEGGYIENGIIHRGSAINRELEELKNFKPMHETEWESMVAHDKLIIDGLAKDDFVLTKEEQIKAGIRKGKTTVIGDKPTDKEILIDIETRTRTAIKECIGKHLFSLMMKLEGTTNADADSAKAYVKAFGHHVDDANIIR